MTVVATVCRRSERLVFRLTVTGMAHVLPADQATNPERRDGLWRQTCAELFVGAVGAPGYLEWNLSPTGHWNLYRFDGYREGGRPEPAIVDAAPHVTRQTGQLAVEATLPLAPVRLADLALEVGVSAVIAEKGGALSHWALHHPAERPDFHDRRGFVLRLDPPSDIGKDQP